MPLATFLLVEPSSAVLLSLGLVGLGILHLARGLPARLSARREARAREHRLRRRLRRSPLADRLSDHAARRMARVLSLR